VAEKAGGAAPAAKAQVAAPTVAPASEAPATQGAVGGLSAGQTMLSVQIASGAADPPPQFRMSPGALMALQRTVGNRAVAAAMSRYVQRVEVTGSTKETLYNQGNAEDGGKAGGHHYGSIKHFQMDRDADAAVNVTVRIKFVHQARNTMPPRKGHPEDPKLGAKKGDPTELPTGDRSWASGIAEKAVAHWQNKLKLVGEDQPRPDAEKVTKKLPVNFKSVAVFDLASMDFDSQVAVHPPGVIGGSTGHPIDAGNYYMKKNDKAYPASDDQIYAHEYGHLIGIPDEYSQSNEQMNLLLHRTAGSEAASAMEALDKKTIEMMVLAALTGPLWSQLRQVMPSISSALRKHRASIKQKMTVAARDAANSEEFRNLLTERLTAISTEKVKPGVPKAVASQTTTNFKQQGVANVGVESVFSPAALTTQIGDTYWDALTAPANGNITLPGLGDVNIKVHDSIFKASVPPKRGTSAVATAARSAAKQEVGEKAKPGLPKTPAPGTVNAQLVSEAGTWDGAGGTIEQQITPDAFKEKMIAILTTATAAAVAPPPPGASAAPPAIKSQQQLLAKAWQLVSKSANEACTQLASELITSKFKPILETSVGQIRVVIAAEVDRIMGMSPAEMAANPSPDPIMEVLVKDMKGRLDTAKTALAGTGMDPLGVSGATTPAQDVTYSYEGMMGSGTTRAVRPDQFGPIVDGFNNTLKLATEQPFKAETS